MSTSGQHHALTSSRERATLLTLGAVQFTHILDYMIRGGFMSVNAALQQATSGLANVLAGLFITRDPAGHLLGYPTLSYVSVGFFFPAVLCAVELRSAAPHVSTPAKNGAASPPAPVEAAA